MRVLILGIDALDFELVEGFDLKNIQQSEYGMVSIPKECYVKSLENTLQAWTPFVWSAFLTGKTPNQIDISSLNFYRWDNRLLQFLKEQSRKIGIDKIKGKSKFFETLGFKQHYHNKYDFKVSTFFDFAQNPIDIDVPCYSKDWKFKLEVKKENMKEYFKESLSDFKKMKKVTFNKIHRHWDLFFTYTRHLDICGHLFFGRKTRTWENYILLDNFVEQLKNNLKKEHLFLIVSDHGMKQLRGTNLGIHSDFAFYSSNRSLNVKKPDITDFYDIIVGQLRN